MIKYFTLFLISSMIFIYALGLLSVYVRSPYNRSIIGIIKNTVYLLLFYVVLELLRYNITKKGEKSKIVYISVIVFTSMIEISLGLLIYNLSVKVEILKFQKYCAANEST